MHTSTTVLHYLWPNILPDTTWNSWSPLMTKKDTFFRRYSEMGLQGVRCYWEHRDGLWKSVCSHMGHLCVSAKKDFIPLWEMLCEQLSTQSSLTFLPLASDANNFKFIRVHRFCSLNLPVTFVSFFFPKTGSWLIQNTVARKSRAFISVPSSGTASLCAISIVSGLSPSPYIQKL